MQSAKRKVQNDSVAEHNFAFRITNFAFIIYNMYIKSVQIGKNILENCADFVLQTQYIVYKIILKNFLCFSQSFFKKFLQFNERCVRIYKHSAALGEFCPFAVCDMR